MNFKDFGVPGAHFWQKVNQKATPTWHRKWTGRNLGGSWSGLEASWGGLEGLWVALGAVLERLRSLPGGPT